MFIVKKSQCQYMAWTDNCCKSELEAALILLYATFCNMIIFSYHKPTPFD